MNKAVVVGKEGDSTRWRPAGRFLDEVPQRLYALAHVMFLTVGVWLWIRAHGDSLPYAGTLAPYVLSQVGFLAFFARVITMKMAVLIEQMLILPMLLIIVLKVT